MCDTHGYWDWSMVFVRVDYVEIIWKNGMDNGFYGYRRMSWLLIFGLLSTIQSEISSSCPYLTVETVF